MIFNWYRLRREFVSRCKENERGGEREREGEAEESRGKRRKAIAARQKRTTRKKRGSSFFLSLSAREKRTHPFDTAPRRLKHPIVELFAPFDDSRSRKQFSSFEEGRKEAGEGCGGRENHKERNKVKTRSKSERPFPLDLNDFLTPADDQVHF